MLRISRPDSEQITNVQSVEQAEPAIQSTPPGRYHVNELSADPLPSGHTSRRWGVAIRQPDGSVDLEPDPWEA